MPERMSDTNQRLYNLANRARVLEPVPSSHTHMPIRQEVLTRVEGKPVYAWVCKTCGDPLYDADPAYVEYMELAHYESEQPCR